MNPVRTSTFSNIEFPFVLIMREPNDTWTALSNRGQQSFDVTEDNEDLAEFVQECLDELKQRSALLEIDVGIDSADIASSIGGHAARHARTLKRLTFHLRISSDG